MNERVVTIRPNATLADAAALMNDLAIDCLPVMSGKVLLGLVTRVNLRRAGLSGWPLAYVLRTPCSASGARRTMKSVAAFR